MITVYHQWAQLLCQTILKGCQNIVRDGFHCVSDAIHNVLMCNIMNQAQYSYQNAILSDTTP